jgi:glycosidase
VVDGDFTLLLPDHPQVFAYTRRLDDEELLVIANLSPRPLGGPGTPPRRRRAEDELGAAEHLVELGVGPELPDLLRTAAGDGDLGSPLQRLLA